MFDLSVLNAKVVSASGVVHGHVYIEDGKIAAICEKPLTVKAEHEIDAGGRFVIPGIVDEHVHIIDMDNKELGRFEMDSEAAAVAGITTIMEMPLTIPPTITLEAYHKKQKRAAESFVVDYALYGGAVPGNCSEIIKMHKAGAIGFKSMMVDCAPEMFSSVGDGDLVDVFKTVAECGSTLAIHAENGNMIHHIEERLKEAGKCDMKAFFDSRPILQENEAVSRALLLQRESGARTIIVHVSNPGAVELVRKARYDGYDVHCETGPHYLCLSEEDAQRAGPYMKYAPPSRSRVVTEELWDELAKGHIETIGSDHGGHLRENKEAGWENIWNSGNGALMMETSLPIMLSEGVNKKRISIERLVEVMCENPSKLFRIFPQKGTLQVGSDADFCILDMEKEFAIDASKFHSYQKHSPFDGYRGKGVPVLVAVRGVIVAKDGEICAKPGFGRQVFPTRKHD